MLYKIKTKIALLIIFTLFLIGAIAWYYTPKYFPTPFKKPTPTEQQKQYAYYEILDEKTGEPLMYVSVVNVSKRLSIIRLPVPLITV